MNSFLHAERHRRGVADGHCWPLRALHLFAVAAMFALQVSATERTYYEVFSNALTNGSTGWMSDSALLNTNNPGPSITNVPFKQFYRGELAGIKLGMTMSEVVAAWGKPRVLASGVIGPRFGYGPGGPFGDLSLCFRGDKLLLIAISGATAKRLAFDNGLTGSAGSADFEKALGEPSARNPQNQSMYNGQIAYRAGPIRTDFDFERGDESPSKEQLRWAAVRIESEVNRYRPLPPGANKPMQPTPR